MDRRAAALLLAAAACGAILAAGTTGAVPVAEGEGWYFVERIVRVPYDAAAANVGGELYGTVIEVESPCPGGYDATACIGSTVPSAIGHVDIAGPQVQLWAGLHVVVREHHSREALQARRVAHDVMGLRPGAVHEDQRGVRWRGWLPGLA